MANKLYKAFVAVPHYALDKNGVLLDLASVMSDLKLDVAEVSDYARYVVRNDDELLPKLKAETSTATPAEIGRRLGITMPDYLRVGKKGNSRKERLLRYSVVVEAKSWLERIDRASGESDSYMSSGYKRTVNGNAPSYSDKQYLNMGAVDHQYCRIVNNPFADGEIVMEMVVRGTWVTLIFPFNPKRFEGARRISNPLAYLDRKGNPKFSFSVEYEAQYAEFSSDYVIGVDVGVANYATVSVVNQKTRQVVHTTTLSQRVHSLYNSVRASSRQIASLQRLGRPYEAALHRRKNVTKKRELAILAAQEIAELSYIYDNAIIAVEDLSWITNTMQNGRWNRGELVRWLKHYQSLNGGVVMSVSAYNTSQVCHVCGNKGRIRNWHTFICKEHGEFDRDENAATNIALRPVDKGSVAKATRTRSKNKEKVAHAQNRVPQTRESLKYPGRDRTKSGPTPQRKTKRHKVVSVPNNSSPVTSIKASVVTDGNSHGIVGTKEATRRFFNLYYKDCSSR